MAVKTPNFIDVERLLITFGVKMPFRPLRRLNSIIYVSIIAFALRKPITYNVTLVGRKFALTIVVKLRGVA